MMLTHVIRGVTATGIIVATVVPDIPTDWVSMVERLGLAVALVLFFTWTGWLREKRMASRLDRLEMVNADLERENAKLAERVSHITDQVSEALQKESTVVADALKILEGRTCYALKNRDEFEEMKALLREWKAEKRSV